jgi:hypothetical protein
MADPALLILVTDAEWGCLTPGPRRAYGSATFALRAMSFIPGLPIPRGYSLSPLVGPLEVDNDSIDRRTPVHSHRRIETVSRAWTASLSIIARTVVENVNASKRRANPPPFSEPGAMNSRLVRGGLHHEYVCICVFGTQ